MKISQMPLSTTPSSDDVLAMLEGGTQNKKITFGAVAEWIANEEEIDNLNTNSKTIVGAVNELEELIGDATANTQAKIKNLQDTAYVTNTASGDIAVFNDGAAADAKSVVIHVEPVQSGSGDPSPDNVRPISGRTGATIYRTGKNLFSQDDTNYLNTTVHSYGASDPNAVAQINRLPAGTYALSFKAKVTDLRGSESVLTNIGLYLRANSNGGEFNVNGQIPITPVVDEVYSKTVTFTITDEYAGKFVSFYVYTGKNIQVTPEVVYDGIIYDVQIENNPTATPYAPYTGTTYPVSWETEAGTVYGGELDVVSGKLTVDRAVITYTGDASENWINYPGHNGYYINNPNMKRGSRHNGICNRLKISYTSAAGQSNAFWLGVGSQQIFVIGVYDSMGATREEFISYLSENPLQFVYPLDQSIEYQLTPQQIQTLLGDNVVWSDAGGVSVDYRADAKSYINNLFSSIQGNIAFIENGTTASRAYTVGQYVIVGGTMYKVTATIASGATFTPGTNIVATTVGTELTTALNA